MTVEVYDSETKEIIASIEITDTEVKGICKDGYSVSVDGDELEIAKD